MNSALLYRTRGRWMFWIAFGCAAAMHIGAVVLALLLGAEPAVERQTLARGLARHGDPENGPS